MPQRPARTPQLRGRRHSVEGDRKSKRLFCQETGTRPRVSSPAWRRPDNLGHVGSRGRWQKTEVESPDRVIDARWKYVSVRRSSLFLERSIYEGKQWTVFELNDDRLRARVIGTVRLFLRTHWRFRALFGRSGEEAFFITSNRTMMAQLDILNGRIICEIGIAPVRPAEFVIVRNFQNTAEAQNQGQGPWHASIPYAISAFASSSTPPRRPPTAK